MFPKLEDITVQFKDLFEYSLDFIFVQNLDGRLIDINDVALNQIGFSKERIFRTVKNLININELKESKIVKIKKKDGNDIVLDIYGIPLKINGKIKEIIVIGRKLSLEKSVKQNSKRRSLNFVSENIRNFGYGLKEILSLLDKIKTLNKLGDFKENFITIAEKSFMGILIIQDNLIKYVNKKAEEIFGYDKKEIMNLKPNVFINMAHPDDKEKTAEYYNKVQSDLNDSFGEFQNRIITKGEVKYIHHLIKKIFYEAKSANLWIFNNITDFKTTEIDLKESLKKYQLIAENANDLIAIVNEDLEHIYVNEYAYRKILGYSYNEMLNLNASEIMHPDDFERFRNYPQFFKLIRENSIKERRVELRVRHKNGHYIWVESIAKAFTDNQGESKLITISRDINERKKVEIELKESEDNLRIILEKAVPAFALFDLEGKILMVNNQALKMTGYTREEFLQKNTMEVALEVGPMEHKQKLWEPLEVGKHINVTGTHKRKDGSVFPAETTLVRINLKGQPVIAAFVQDITKKNETERKLKISEEMYRIISKNTNDIISIVNNEGRYLYCNDAFKRILGYEPEELIGTLGIELVHPEDISVAYKDINNLIKTGLVKNEMRVRCKDGSYKWLDSVGGAIYDKNNKLIKIIGISRDITGKKKAEQNLKESEEMFRTIAEQSLMGIAIAQDNKIKYMNKKIADIWGYSIEEIKEWQLEDVINAIHPDDRALVLGQLTRKQQGESDVITQYQYRGIKRSGETIWVDHYSKPIQFRGKVAILVTLIDITEKKEVEQKLRESEEMFRKISEQSKVGISIIQNATLVYVNDALARSGGYTIDEVLNWRQEDFLKIVFPEYRKIMIDNLERTLLSDKMDYIDFNLKCIKKNQDVFWVKLIWSKIQYKGFPAILGIVIDITDQIKAEQRLLKSKMMYKTERDNFVNILNSMEDGVYIINQQYDIEYANPALKRVFGSFKGKKCYEYIQDCSEICQWCKINDVIKGKTVRMEQFYEKHQKTYDIIDTPLRKADGTIVKLQILRDITDRKKAERNLEESEEKFRKITEQSLMGICIVQDNKVKYLNQRFADIWGYSIEEMMPWKLNDIANAIHPDDRIFILEQLAKKQSGEKNIYTQYQYRGFKKSGEMIWVDNYSRSFKYQDKPADIVTIIDITEKKEAELKLKESEEKFRTIAEQSLIGIGIIQDNIVKYLNDKFADILGYSTEEILNWSPKEFLLSAHPDEREFISEQARKKQEGLNDYLPHFEFQAIKKSGEVIWIDNYTRSIPYEGRPADLVTFIDITAQRLAEQRILKSKMMYKTERDNFINILNSMEDGVYIVNQQYDIEYANPAFIKIFGSFKAKKCYEYTRNCSEICRDCKMNDILDGKTNRSEQFYEKPQKTYDVIETPLRKADGSIVKLKIFRDITDRKEAERLILEENKKLIELDKIREELITRVSHELKTPLVPLLNGSELLKTLYKDQLGEEAKEIIDMINESALRLKSLTTNLLDASRIEYNEFELLKKNENLVELIHESIDELSYFINNRQLKLKLILPEAIYLNVDKTRMIQTITNLLSNAIKNTPAGGEIYIKAEEYPECIDIEIKDSGVGITETEKQRLFKKFGKIERYGKGLDVDIEGSGLGLYISNHLAKLHNGEILVESGGRNKGAIFTIRLFKK